MRHHYIDLVMNALSRCHRIDHASFSSGEGFFLCAMHFFLFSSQIFFEYSEINIDLNFNQETNFFCLRLFHKHADFLINKRIQISNKYLNKLFRMHKSIDNVPDVHDLRMHRR